MGLSADEAARQAHYQMVYEHKACIPNGGLAPPDFVDCPACGRSFVAADQGHVLCRRCEGTERPPGILRKNGLEMP